MTYHDVAIISLEWLCINVSDWTQESIQEIRFLFYVGTTHDQGRR